MFEYPPRLVSWSDLLWPSLLSAAVLIPVGWHLWRPGRKSQRTDPVIWCAIGFLVLYMLELWSLVWMGVPSETDSRAIGRVLLTALIVVHSGVLISLAKSAWEREWEVFGRGSQYALLAIGAGWWVLALFVPANAASHRAPRLRSSCKDQMKQIVHGMHDFHDQEQHFPIPAAGEPPVSWRVNLLPYLDQKELFAKYDQTLPWTAPPNAQLRTQRVEVYECPAVEYWQTRRHPADFARTSYALPVGPRAVFDSTSPRTFRDVPDGLSNVIALLEVCGMNIIWSEPRDVNVEEAPWGINSPGSQPAASDSVLSSLHRGGAQVAFADGSVRFLRRDTDPSVLRQLLERDDGQPVGDF